MKKNLKSFILIFLILMVAMLFSKISYSKEINLALFEGTWEGIENSKTQGSKLVISHIKDNSFEFTIDAFWMNTITNCPHVGNMSGKGYLKNNVIKLTMDNGDLNANMNMLKDKIHIKFLGDTSYYGGMNVTFATDYQKKINK